MTGRIEAGAELILTAVSSSGRTRRMTLVLIATDGGVFQRSVLVSRSGPGNVHYCSNRLPACMPCGGGNGSDQGIARERAGDIQRWLGNVRHFPTRDAHQNR